MMKAEIEIFWNDLTPEKQKEILDILGDNNNWDVYPITTIYISEEKENAQNLEG